MIATDSEPRRLTAISAALCAALYLVVGALIADSPGTGIPEAETAQWMRAHSGRILAATYLWGLCVCATLTFLTAFASFLRQRDPSPWPTLGMASGYVIYAVSLVGFAGVATAAYRADTLEPSTLKLLNDLMFLSVSMTGFPTAISMLGYLASMRRGQPLWGWLQPFGWAVLAAHLVSGGAFAADGLLSPSGIGVFVAPVLYYAWILAVGACLWVHRARG